MGLMETSEASLQVSWPNEEDMPNIFQSNCLRIVLNTFWLTLYQIISSKKKSYRPTEILSCRDQALSTFV